MKRKFYWDLSVDEKMKRNRLFYLIFGAFGFVSFYVRFSLESALTFVVIAIIGIVNQTSYNCVYHFGSAGNLVFL